MSDEIDTSAPLPRATQVAFKRAFGAMPYGGAAHFTPVETIEDVLTNLDLLRGVLERHSENEQAQTTRLVHLEGLLHAGRQLMEELTPR